MSTASIDEYIKPSDDTNDIYAVNSIIAGMSKNTQDDVTRIFKKFCSIISTIIRMIETITKRKVGDHTDILVEIDTLKRILNFTPADEVFLRCRKKFLCTSDKIIQRDEKWFTSQTFDAAIKRDKNQNLIVTLRDMIQQQFPTLGEDEKNIYWANIINLLRLVLIFQKIISGCEYGDDIAILAEM